MGEEQENESKYLPNESDVTLSLPMGLLIKEDHYHCSSLVIPVPVYPDGRNPPYGFTRYAAAPESSTLRRQAWKLKHPPKAMYVTPSSRTPLTKFFEQYRADP